MNPSHIDKILSRAHEIPASTEIRALPAFLIGLALGAAIGITFAILVGA